MTTSADSVIWCSTAHIDELLARLQSTAGPPLVVAHHNWSPTQHAHARNLTHKAVLEDRLRDGDVVLFSSGSTGQPRGIIRTRASWHSSLPALTIILGATPNDRVLIPGSPIGTMSLYAHFHAYETGCDVGTNLNPDGVTDATLVHLVPTSVSHWLDLVAQDRAPRLRTIVTAGDHLSDDAFLRGADLGVRIIHYYGAAELSFVGWRDSIGPFRDFPGVRTKIIDDQLWVHSAYVAREALAQVGAWQWSGNWSSVGDMASPRAGGWMVRGRGDLAVTTGGHTINVEEIEQALRNLPGIIDVAVVGRPHPRLGEQLTCVWVGDATESQLRAATRSWSPPTRPRRWRCAPVIARTASGKIDRLALHDWLDRNDQG